MISTATACERPCQPLNHVADPEIRSGRGGASCDQAQLPCGRRDLRIGGRRDGVSLRFLVVVHQMPLFLLPVSRPFQFDGLVLFSSPSQGVSRCFLGGARSRTRLILVCCGLLLGCSGEPPLTLSPAGFETFLPRVGDESLILSFLARELAGAADGLSFLAGALFRRFLVKSPALHFSEDAFSLHLPFQCFERLIDIVVSDEYLQLFAPYPGRRSHGSRPSWVLSTFRRPRIVASCAKVENQCP